MSVILAGHAKRAILKCEPPDELIAASAKLTAGLDRFASLRSQSGSEACNDLRHR